MTKLTFIGSILLAFSVSSQGSKTIYLTENWIKTDKVNAVYFREIKKERSKLFSIRDFYISGQPQMEGHYQDKKMQTEIGHFIYYDSAGQKTQEINYNNGVRQGEYKRYYPNGEIRHVYTYLDGEREGKYQEYYESGKLRANANYRKANLTGELTRLYENGATLLSIKLDENGTGKFSAFYEDGTLRESGQFEHGMRIGRWITYDASGAIIEEKTHDELKKKKKFDAEIAAKNLGLKRPKHFGTYSPSTDDVFFNSRYVLGDVNDGNITRIPDIEAEFIGGAIAMKHYIQQNVVYPPKALQKRKEGRIFLSFVVEADGSISNVQVIEGHRYFHKEGIRIVTNMPKWRPGESNGKKVRTRCRLPITFSID